MEFAWRDAYGIEGAQPWKLSLERQPDNPPHRVDCPGQAPVVAILLEEVLDIRMMAEDDYGLKVLSAEWEAFRRGETNRLANGVTVLREFEPRTTEAALEDGVYTYRALVLAGVNTAIGYPVGQVVGYRTCEPADRRAHETGAKRTVTDWGRD